MLVKWNRSAADTQLNFKGYFVELYQSSVDTLGNVDDTLLPRPIATASVLRSGTLIPDTFCTFSQTSLGSSIPEHVYDVVVYGLKDTGIMVEPSGTLKDSATLSQDSSHYAGMFDPLPLTDPTNLEATSTGPTQLLLRWTPATLQSDTGFYRYVIYYRDTTLSHDTGHVIATVAKWTPPYIQGEQLVGVPSVTLPNQTTTEWPYKFWIKTERIDSTYFYGIDTNAVIWAGAEQVPRVGNDTGYLRVYDGDTIYFGSLNNQFDVAIDSSKSGKGQVAVSISGNTVTLTATPPGGVDFMDRIDQDSTLGSMFYSGPLDDPAQFDQSSITLPAVPTSGGAIVYVMMNDDVQHLGNMWARIFIRAQSNGTYINSSGAIDIKASFQPGVTKDGSKHLGYY